MDYFRPLKNPIPKERVKVSSDETLQKLLTQREEIIKAGGQKAAIEIAIRNQRAKLHNRQKKDRAFF